MSTVEIGCELHYESRSTWINFGPLSVTTAIS